MSDTIDYDLEYEDHAIAEVTQTKEDPPYVSVGMSDAGWIGVGLLDGNPLPEIGQTIRIYGRGFGYPVRGIAIDGVVYRYESAEAYKDRRAREASLAEEESIEAWMKGLDAYNVRLNSLPEPMRDRVQQFIDHNASWGRQYGEYELMVCEQAVLMAEAFPTPIKLHEFRKMNGKDQKAALPGLEEGHSGNTFGAAVSLAGIYLTDPELLPEIHGALCPLTGCKDYGCYASRVNAEEVSS